MEYVVAAIVIVAATLSALLLGWRQVRQVRWLRENEAGLNAEDQRYHTWSVRRRFVGCLLLLGLAVMVYGLYAFGIAGRLEELIAQAEQAQGEKPVLNDEQRDFVYNAMAYVGALTVLLLLLFVVAAWDMQAIRNYGRRHRRRIRDDRRAMLERQLPLLYAERRARRQALRDADGATPDS